jgi:hypothetical protein
MHVCDNLAVLLSKAAEVMLIKSSGEISLNRIDFTHCRSFGSESKVDFDTNEPVPAFATSTVDDTLRLLPAGLQIRVTLQRRIKADTTVGSIIEGIVPTNVVANRAVVIPAGSPVRGRLRRLEYYNDPSPYYVVGLEFTEIEIGGIRHLFFANRVDAGTVPGVESQLRFSTGVARALRGDMLQTTQRSESVFAYDLPGVATFFLRGQTLALPPAFTTTWKTRLLKP